MSSTFGSEDGVIELINFFNQVAKCDADAETSTIAEMARSPQYGDLLSKWIGVEVVSFYVVIPPSTKPKGFLSDSIEYLPMFRVEGDHWPRQFQPLDPSEVTSRRERQQLALELSNEKTSAELCSIPLHRDRPYLIVYFGEIIAYCFLYHVLQVTKDSSHCDFDVVGNDAWEVIAKAYARNPDIGENSNDVLFSAVKRWYEEEAPTVDREFLVKKVNAIYELSEETLALLRNSPDHANSSRFMCRWANELHRSFKGTESIRLADYWDRSLINPNIEMALCSRGLYVTVIRSRLQSPETASLARGGGPPHSLSRAYAICTVHDVSRITPDDRWRVTLDQILRRLAYEGLAKHDYATLRRNFCNVEERERLHLAALKFQDDVANRDVDWIILLEKAAELCHRISSGAFVVVAWYGVGVFIIQRCDDGTFKRGWFSPLSKIAALCNAYCHELSVNEDDTHSDLVDRQVEQTNSARGRVLGCLGIDTQGEIYSFHSGERQGLILTGGTDEDGESKKSQLQKVADALAIGMTMPFRSAAGLGILSLIVTSALHVVQRFVGSNAKTPGRANSDPFLKLAVASLAEFAKIGFVAIGALFLALAAVLIYETGSELFADIGYTAEGSSHSDQNSKHNEQGKSQVVALLNGVEHSVMAFSICLAATGVIFLLAPGMAAGQPKWMRSFAELGTLEKTLVRLTAMVLTIDVLKAVLRATEADAGNGGSMKTSVILYQSLVPVVLYLAVLLGLALVSHMLLKEEKENAAEHG